MTESELREWFESNAIETVRVQSVALDGWLYGKHVSARKFLGAPDAIPTADLVLGIDLSGTPLMAWWDDWRTEIGDIVHVPDHDTLVATARPGLASVFADVHLLSGEPVPIDPRSALRRITGRLAELGYSANVALELEAYVFAESLGDARDRTLSELTPLGGPSKLTYPVGRMGELVDYMDAVATRVQAMGIDWEGWLSEYGPGQIEFNVAPSDPLDTADSILRVKTAMRDVAHEQGRSVTFMSKPIDGYGSGLHVNHSLQRDGEPVFLDPDTPDGRSAVMKQWLGGLIASMAASNSFFSPNITSYRRFVELDGPPTTITWGENNKTTAIRSVTRTAKETRFEHRVPGSDANPYLAIAAVLAAGIRGLEDQLEPPEEFVGMAWALPPSSTIERLPNTITRAAEALNADPRFTEIMGPELVEHWIQTRRWEWLMFHTTGGDPDAFTGSWERDRYFEWV